MDILQESEEVFDSMDDVMFIVGAQRTNDGDMLPESFTVFSWQVNPIEAVSIIAGKIHKEFQELGIQRSSGSMAFKPIRTWQDFAELEVDDHVKMKALAGGIAAEFLAALASGDTSTIGSIASLAWVPRSAR